MLYRNKKYLITCRRFTAPDGLQYNSVWGNAEILKAENVFGFPVKGQDSNFIVKVIGKTRTLFIPGDGFESAIVECRLKFYQSKVASDT